MPLPFRNAPERLCILRLSAIGDICHTLPVVRTLQHAWPDTRLTWIIGKTEAQLVGDIPGIEFLIFDKHQARQSYRELKKQLQQRSFDALLHMQMSLRSSLLNRYVRTPVRLGFDRARAKDLQWLFNNYRIAAHKNQHVMDSLFGFSEALGIEDKCIHWDIPINEADTNHIQSLLHTDKAVLVISPCSSMAYRNWHAQGYAAIGDYAVEKYNAKVVLSGGASELELQVGSEIESLAKHKPLNLIGKTNLKQLLALLKQAKAVVSPDSGPAHMATAVDTPVIGLYACTNPDRARPYLSEATVVNRYPDAIKKKYGKEVGKMPWGIRVKDEWAMDLISVEDVVAKLDLVMG